MTHTCISSLKHVFLVILSFFSPIFYIKIEALLLKWKQTKPKYQCKEQTASGDLEVKSGHSISLFGLEFIFGWKGTNTSISG